jgi:hypothetical protein
MALAASREFGTESEGLQRLSSGRVEYGEIEFMGTVEE